ncbi:hypothetical protein EMQ25_16900 [Arsenicitalea aurantiaca]|uniref:2-dehydro-3-deoxygalactonokinase n=1 Tax=Arsenicitalea aurantiaca TaxID=1783274 RepID=A0A433X2E7_9HYPH|nr:2-dehydro-3-deoxygalactonokinase [Arsenicitalea aurantiaca]RUT28265.1 hypothetical protein EMQ25_16900 [Arsenicitalea aurantiaca]
MFIAVQWTSGAFHAWLLEADGSISAEHQSRTGVNSVLNGAFEAALRAEIGHWLPSARAVLLSGMVTSRTGWVESPFAIVPAGASDLLAEAVRKEMEGLPPLYFLAGAARRDPLPDVMRGEEMAIFGIKGDLPEWVVLPGAHSKWVRTDGEHIVDVTTYMSGEILDLLLKDSLLSKLIPAGASHGEEAFARGVAIAADKRAMQGGVLQRLFSARSLVLFDRLKPDEITGYMSGVMIGSEIIEALAGQPEVASVAVLGETPLAASYRQALQAFGIAAPVVTGSAAAGFARLVAEMQRER